MQPCPPWPWLTEAERAEKIAAMMFVAPDLPRKPEHHGFMGNTMSAAEREKRAKAKKAQRVARRRGRR